MSNKPKEKRRDRKARQVKERREARERAIANGLGRRGNAGGLR